MLPFVASLPMQALPHVEKTGRRLGTRLTISSFMRYTNHSIARVVQRHCTFMVNSYHMLTSSDAIAQFATSHQLLVGNLPGSSMPSFGFDASSEHSYHNV